jgi:hypothetical protein
MTTTFTNDLRKIEGYKFTGHNAHELIRLVGDHYIAHNTTPEELIISTDQGVFHVALGDWLVLDNFGFLSSTTVRKEDLDA